MAFGALTNVLLCLCFHLALLPAMAPCKVILAEEFVRHRLKLVCQGISGCTPSGGGCKARVVTLGGDAEWCYGQGTE